MLRSLSFALGQLWARRAAKVRARVEPDRFDTGVHETGPGVRIRPAIHSDYEQICELYEELDFFHRRARPDLFDRPSAPPRGKSMISALIKGQATTILVAQEARSERLLGFAVLGICNLPASSVCRARQFVEIDKLAVRAEARRTGIGRAILDAALAWAEDRGFDCVEVAVHEFNSSAIALYESMGFTTVVRRMMRKG